MAAPGRGSAVCAVAVVLLALACLDDAYAVTHTVGGSKGWDLGVDYATWAAGETFSVGDVLFFPYTVSAHNVVVVNKNGYDACSDTNAITTYSAGNDNVTINAAGTHYYLCSVVGHCSGGMKLAVTVSAAAAAPVPTASTPAPTKTPPSTAPSPAKTVPSTAPAPVLVSPVPAPTVETPASVPAPAPAAPASAPSGAPASGPTGGPPTSPGASPGVSSAGSPPSPSPPNAAPSLLTSAAAVTPLALILAALLAL